jgi:cytochrome d ubiquinol oxidase subunit II
VTLQATVIVVAVGMLILGPSLWFLYRLVLSGQLDQTYEPLDQRYKPVE